MKNYWYTVLQFPYSFHSVYLYLCRNSLYLSFVWIIPLFSLYNFDIKNVISPSFIENCFSNCNTLKMILHVSKCRLMTNWVLFYFCISLHHFLIILICYLFGGTNFWSLWTLAPYCLLQLAPSPFWVCE